MASWVHLQSLGVCAAVPAPPALRTSGWRLCPCHPHPHLPPSSCSTNPNPRGRHQEAAQGQRPQQPAVLGPFGDAPEQQPRGQLRLGEQQEQEWPGGGGQPGPPRRPPARAGACHRQVSLAAAQRAPAPRAGVRAGSPARQPGAQRSARARRVRGSVLCVHTHGGGGGRPLAGPEPTWRGAVGPSAAVRAVDTVQGFCILGSWFCCFRRQINEELGSSCMRRCPRGSGGLGKEEGVCASRGPRGQLRAETGAERLGRPARASAPLGRACPQVDAGGSAPAGRSPPRPVPGAPVRVALDARSAGGLLAAHGGHGAPTPPRPQGPTASVLQVPPRSLCRRRWPPRDQTLHPCAVWRARRTCALGASFPGRRAAGQPPSPCVGGLGTTGSRAPRPQILRR